MFNFPLKENIVTRTAIGKQCLTALHSNCGGSLTKIWGIKLNSFQLDKKKKSIRILVTTFNLVRHLEQLLLPRICLFDRQLMMKFNIDNGH